MHSPNRERRPWGRRVLLIAAGILVLAAVALPTEAFAVAKSGGVSPSLSTASSCPNFIIVGARGSGQPDETSGKFRGLGPEVDKMVSVLQVDIGKAHFSTGIKAINYPAVSVKVLLPTKAQIKLFAKNPAAALANWYSTNVKKFMSSIAAGVSATVKYTESATAGVCRTKNTAFILVGYSQGAMVVHEAELQLKKAEDKGTSFAFGRIGGTLLLADGYKVKKTIAKQFGTYKPGGQGVATALGHGVGDVPGAGSTADICNANDVVCDFSAKLFVHIPSILTVHTSYAKCNAKDQCTYMPVLTSAANWVASGAIP
jgi:Cutinase